MTTITELPQSKIRTTLYLTKENRSRLDLIPKGKRTELMNNAIAKALKDLEAEQNGNKLMEMIASIKPVSTQYSSEEMVRLLREDKMD